MKKIWRTAIDQVSPYRPGKPIEEVKREYGLDRVVKLASNENPIGPSPAVIEAMKSAAGRVNRYPDGGCYYLREELSSRLSVPPGNMVFGNGSDELILMTLRALIEPGDEVVVADPTFLIYHIASMIKGAKVSAVPLKDYKYDLVSMLKAVTPRTKVVFLANPDNPTGSYVSDPELADFLDEIPEDVLVFIDEAYYEYAAGGDYPETIDLYKREDISVVVARTFSKAYSLAGLRIGYGVTRPDLAEVLNKVREPFNVNLIAQEAALAALRDPDHLARSIDLAKREKERYYAFFSSMGMPWLESRTNFIVADTGRDSSAVCEQLLKKGVVIRDMAAWKMKGFVRVNVGLEEENDIFFKAFREVVQDIPPYAGVSDG